MTENINTSDNNIQVNVGAKIQVNEANKKENDKIETDKKETDKKETDKKETDKNEAGSESHTLSTKQKVHNRLNLQPINYQLPAITLQNYTKKFRKFVATKNVSFTVGHGVIHGFIGPNGSGKTTTIKALIGAYISEKGQISINGHPAGSQNANGLIGYIPERASFPKHLNCIDYLSIMAQLSGLMPKEARPKAKIILKELGLEEHAKRKPITFSSGMQKKILLAQALITNPDILILDEPAANLDPTARKELFDELIKLRQQGKTILLSSHILAELERLIDEVTFIYKGKVVFSGKVAKIENENSDVYIKTSDNKAISDFIKKQYSKYQITGDLKTEIIVKNLNAAQAKELFSYITTYPDISIKSLRANDLQSIYDKLIVQAELDIRKTEQIDSINTKKHKTLFKKKPETETDVKHENAPNSQIPPKADAPKTEAPKVDAPKIEKTAEPVKDEKTKEPVKAEAPKTEKAEESVKDEKTETLIKIKKAEAPKIEKTAEPVKEENMKKNEASIDTEQNMERGK